MKTLVLLVALLIVAQQTNAFFKFDPAKSWKKLIDEDPLKILKPFKDLFEEKKEAEAEKFEKKLDKVMEKKIEFDDKIKEFFGNKDKIKHVKDNIKEALEEKECEYDKPYERKTYEPKPYKPYRPPAPSPPPPPPPPPPPAPCRPKYRDCDDEEEEEEEEEETYEDRRRPAPEMRCCDEVEKSERYSKRVRYDRYDHYEGAST